MNKKDLSETKLHELRKRAEQRLTTGGKWDIARMTTEDVATMLYELETHQVELEMQNEEMHKLQEQLVEMRDQYATLYNCAPVGYVTMDEKGLIMQANLTFAKVLDVPEGQLINQPLSEFIVADDQDTYYAHLRESLDAKDGQTCALHLRKPEGQTLWVRLRTARAESPARPCDRLRSVICILADHSEVEG
jgi:PAS domain S-box-containing protein